MEEINCEQGEAELALELSDNDLEKAIKTIGSILKQIFVIKGKFFLSSRNLYGLFIIVLNTKTRSILRLHTVVSYNPNLYENSASMDWYALEKLIFYYRLDEGSIPDLSQEIEEKVKVFISSNKEIYSKKDPGEIQSILADFFSQQKIDITITTEELNLAQFRQLPQSEMEINKKPLSHDKDSSAVKLKISIVEDISGLEISHLKEDDVILTQISDSRDIAHYLAHLIGGRRDGKMISLPATVKKIAMNSLDSYDVQVYFAPGILGECQVGRAFRIKRVESKKDSWWKKVIPWS